MKLLEVDYEWRASSPHRDQQQESGEQLLFSGCASTTVLQSENCPDGRLGPTGQVSVIARDGPDDALGRILERRYLDQAEEEVGNNAMGIVERLCLLGHDHGTATSALSKRELFAQSALATPSHADDADRGHAVGQCPVILVLEAG
jgi:hypothetical protein